jgi:hypothetical protein
MDDNQDDMQEYLQKKVDEFKAMATDKNIDAVSAGMGSVFGYASLAGGEAAIAAEVGVALVGTAAAAPIVALGIGFLTYKAFGGFARKAIRELDYKMKNGGGQSDGSDPNS